jgi:hypothetical protein
MQPHVSVAEAHRVIAIGERTVWSAVSGLCLLSGVSCACHSTVSPVGQTESPGRSIKLKRSTDFCGPPCLQNKAHTPCAIAESAELRRPPPCPRVTCELVSERAASRAAARRRGALPRLPYRDKLYLAACTLQIQMQCLQLSGPLKVTDTDHCESVICPRPEFRAGGAHAIFFA